MWNIYSFEPGRLPLHPIRFSLVDVPDLQVLPKLWPGLRSVWMGAGPVPDILHRALSALANLALTRLQESEPSRKVEIKAPWRIDKTRTKVLKANPSGPKV